MYTKDEKVIKISTKKLDIYKKKKRTSKKKNNVKNR